MLNLLALVFQGYPLFTVCFPVISHNHFCALCAEHRHETAYVLTPGPHILVPQCLRCGIGHRYHFKTAGRGRDAEGDFPGERTLELQVWTGAREITRQSADWPQAHNVGRPGTSVLPALAFPVLGLLACSTMPGSSILKGAFIFNGIAYNAVQLPSSSMSRAFPYSERV